MPRECLEMNRLALSRVRSVRRTFLFLAVVALLASATLGVSNPGAGATPATPHFGPNVMITQAPAYTAGNPSIAVGSDGVAYLAFAGWAGPTTGTDVFFTKSSNGRTWMPPVRVNNDATAFAQTNPSLALDSGNNISIAWVDGRSGNQDIWFSRSTNGGQSFSANVLVNLVTTNAQTEVRIAVDPVDSMLIHAVWTDTRTAGNPDIYYANSTDGGLSFNPSSRVNNDAGAAEQAGPMIAVAPNRDVDVVWRDARSAATKGTDIYAARSTNRGATWIYPATAWVNDDSGNVAQQEPTIAIDRVGTIYVAWTDYRSGTSSPDIYAARSTNGGVSFQANVKVNDDVGPIWQFQPSLAANDGKIVVLWADMRTGGSTNLDIYASTSLDGLTWSANVKLNDDSSAANQFQPTVGMVRYERFRPGRLRDRTRRGRPRLKPRRRIDRRPGRRDRFQRERIHGQPRSRELRLGLRGRFGSHPVDWEPHLSECGHVHRSSDRLGLLGEQRNVHDDRHGSGHKGPRPLGRRGPQRGRNPVALLRRVCVDRQRRGRLIRMGFRRWIVRKHGDREPCLRPPRRLSGHVDRDGCGGKFGDLEFPCDRPIESAPRLDRDPRRNRRGPHDRRDPARMDGLGEAEAG